MNSYQDHYQALLNLLPEQAIRIQEPLCHHTYTRMGGPADLFVTPSTYEEAARLIRYASQHAVPVTILGYGSNVIVQDGGIRGIVLNFEQLKAIRAEGNLIHAQSGASIIEVSRFALAERLGGLEFACGIPGSVGGALYMNAGAYGGEICDVLKEALVVTPEGELLTLTKDELELSYRKSIIGAKGYTVLKVTFELTPADAAEIKAKMDDLTAQRESKQPLEYPSCGSVFKRPPGYFAGKLIQDSELQGVRIGGAEVSKKHAGFIVNIDQATAKDYVSLIRHVQATVKEKFGVELETEVRIIGEEG